MWNKIQRIYVGSNLVRPKWQPNANTWVYLPLNWDVKDYSWNGRNGSISGSFSYPSIWNISVAQTGSTTSYINVPSYTADISTWFTISIWVKFINANSRWGVFQLSGSSSSVTIVRCQKHSSNDSFAFWSDRASSTPWVTGVGSNLQSWQHLAVAFDSTWFTVYRNGQYAGKSSKSLSWSHTASVWHQIWQWPNISWSTAQYSNYIIENKTRTADDALVCYETFKSNYGL